MKFKKKPAVIEAIVWNGSNLSETPEWITKAINANNGDMTIPGSVMRLGDKIHICAMEGVIMIASPGDYIIKHPNGHITCCTAKIFADKYENL